MANKHARLRKSPIAHRSKIDVSTLSPSMAVLPLSPTSPSTLKPCSLSPITPPSPASPACSSSPSSPMPSPIGKSLEPTALQVHQSSVSDMLQTHLDTLLQSSDDEDMQPKSAFYVADLGEVYRLHLQWKALLPRIEPFYALKCNPDPTVVRLLAALGAGFDCASTSEIRMMINAGVDPNMIIHANPCKEVTQVKYSRANNVVMSTFDNEDELIKIKELFPESKLLLRILVDDSRSHCKFGVKFGAALEDVNPVLAAAKRLELDVVGVSFHVGSGCFDETAFGDAVVRARHVFDLGKDHGFDFKVLDVGGGFPSASDSTGITFQNIAKILGSTVDRLFGPEIRVIAEPGRYYVSSAYTLATQVIARRIIPSKATTPVCDKGTKRKSRSSSTDTSCNVNENTLRMYYVNDGVYGSFSGIYYDNMICNPRALLHKNQFCYNKDPVMDEDQSNITTSVWGPTMDSLDCLSKEAKLPLMSAGDWMYFENMGAYTVAAASLFHGFSKSEVLYTTTEPEVAKLLKLE
ncbi:hypothetical protein BGZ94_009400 [Podila epigama]|nr:hypothetical protein BGZ94_009400 [Podila epigama]